MQEQAHLDNAEHTLRAHKHNSHSAMDKNEVKHEIVFAHTIILVNTVVKSWTCLDTEAYSQNNNELT